MGAVEIISGVENRDLLAFRLLSAPKVRHGAASGRGPATLPSLRVAGLW